MIQAQSSWTKSNQAGFTLLEILLVIVMIAVTSAMVMPSIYIAGPSLEDETRRLRIVMRMAMEESQLTTVPLRWVATQQGWHFEALVLGEASVPGEEVREWLRYEHEPLETYALPQGIIIGKVEQAGDFMLPMEVMSAEKEEAVPVVGMVLFLPDGTTSLSNIRLMSEHQGASSVLLIRPGPSGIRLESTSDG